MAEPAFLDNLRKSRLLSEKQLAALAPLADGDAKALAEALVRREWLTEFQVQQVAAGNGVHLRLGEYILLDLLGEGAMGEVYRASHIRHGIVALKVMRREKLGNPAAVQRFAREINLAAKLIHPHIVRAVECGSAAGHYFLAMEFLPGPDLSRLVKEGGPLPIQAACEYIRQAALALHHAHEQGVIHRDLKPANLMLNATGDVKLLDLGLARRDEGEANLALTRLGQVIGTPDYLAPEQAIDARKADARADIYSLGCTLFYLVAGKPPFSAVSLADLLLKHQTEAARPLKSLRPDAPDWLVQLIGWMMNKRREDRPGSGLEVAAKIEELLADHQAAPPPVPPAADPWSGLDEKKPGKPPSGPAPGRWVALGVLLVACAGAAAFMLLPRRTAPEPPPEEKKPPKEEPEDKGWRALFDGKSLSGWKPHKGGADKAGWHVEGGVMWGDNPDTKLFSERGDYADFHFRIEARLDAKGIGGQGFRVKKAGSRGVFTNGYLVQANSDFIAAHFTGSLFLTRDHAKGGEPLRMVDEVTVVPGRWYRQEVIAVGPRIVVLVNGRQVVDFTDPKATYSRGHLTLHSGGGSSGPAMRYRKVEIKELPRAK